MRKSSLLWSVFLALIIGVSLSFSFALKVLADPPANSGNGWSEAWYCDPNIGILFKDAQDNGIVMMRDSSEYSKLVADHPDKCIMNEAVNVPGKFMIGALYSYRNGDILSCSKDTVVARRTESPSEYTDFRVNVWVYAYKEVCCPPDKPYVRDDPPEWYQASYEHYRCCGSADGEKGNKPCPGGGPEAAPISFDYDKVALVPFLTPAVPVYTCPMENCLMRDANTQAPASDKRNNLEVSQIGPNPSKPNPDNPPVTKLCIKSDENAAVPGSSPNLYCISGTILDQATYDEWKNNLTTYVACKDFKDPLESQACLDCLKDQPSRVYSSLGCIDTERNALIIRIMQIGIGIVGGIGVLRLMQAAILRQTADPAKIQESWDIISSVIIGLIILLGSVVILRVLGINVLGLLPFDY